MTSALKPNSTIGILGGGQLGRMLAIAAAGLGYRSAVFEPDPKCPAAQVANMIFANGWQDENALEEFAYNCDVVTYEFENVPVSAAQTLTRYKPLLPTYKALEVAQDRLTEKKFLNQLEIKTAPFFDITDINSLKDALGTCENQGILKTRRLGYDGKGQIRLDHPDHSTLTTALSNMDETPCIMEGFVKFEREISVIVVRDQSGKSVTYDPAENTHRDGILRTSTLPAQSNENVQKNACDISIQIADALNYVGAMGVEFFEMTDGKLYVNEIAPRVHNSGHWTEAACLISQFENHIRAIAGLPILEPNRHTDCVMYNIIGNDLDKIDKIQSEKNTKLHLYGKREIRDGRKMGHYTQLHPK